MAAITAGAADVPPRYITLRDLVELERQPEFVATTVVERAEEWQVVAVLARAMSILAAHRGPQDKPRLLEWAASFRPTRREARLLRSYIGDGRSYRSQLASVAVLPDWPHTPSPTCETSSPPSAVTADARHWSWWTHLRRAADKLTRSDR